MSFKRQLPPNKVHITKGERAGTCRNKPTFIDWNCNAPPVCGTIEDKQLQDKLLEEHYPTFDYVVERSPQLIKEPIIRERWLRCRDKDCPFKIKIKENDSDRKLTIFVSKDPHIKNHKFLYNKGCKTPIPILREARKLYDLHYNSPRSLKDEMKKNYTKKPSLIPFATFLDDEDLWNDQRAKSIVVNIRDKR